MREVMRMVPGRVLTQRLSYPGAGCPHPSSPHPHSVLEEARLVVSAKGSQQASQKPPVESFAAVKDCKRSGEIHF